MLVKDNTALRSASHLFHLMCLLSSPCRKFRDDTEWTSVFFLVLNKIHFDALKGVYARDDFWSTCKEMGGGRLTSKIYLINQ